MTRNDLDSRLRELGLYSEYYYRPELKSLRQMLGADEVLNCILTGLHEGNRRMLAVTDRRIFVIFSGALGSGEFKVIKKEGIRSWSFQKKLLFSKAVIETSEGPLEFRNTQGGAAELFDRAMKELTSA